MNLIRAVNLTVAAGTVTVGAMVYSSWGTRIQPALAYGRQVDRWLMAWREQDFNTSINIATKAAAETAWGPLIRPGPRSHTAPALAYSPQQSRAALWYAFEEEAEMSTEYQGYPTLAGWLRAVQLIATAKVMEIEQLPKAEANDDRREALARVVLGQVIRGAPSSREIALRFVQADSHPYQEKGEILLMAVPDVGPGSRKDTYVAYLGAALPYDGKDVALPIGWDGPDRLVTERLSLDRLQEEVAAFDAAEQERQRLSWDLEKADRFDPAPESTEMPELGVPGPIDSAPLGAAR